MVGVEVQPGNYKASVRNAGRLRFRGAPVELIHTDAGTYDCREGTLFYRYGAFERTSPEEILAHIKRSLKTHPRRVLIVFYSVPQHEVLLAKQDWLRLSGTVENNACLVWESVPRSQTRPGKEK